jgi:hypothetical protein
MGTCTQEKWTDMPTASTGPPGWVIRPKYGQMTIWTRDEDEHDDYGSRALAAGLISRAPGDSHPAF